MQTFKCRECGAMFILDRDVDVEGVECPMAGCGSDDLAEFVEADEDDEDEDEDEHDDD